MILSFTPRGSSVDVLVVVALLLVFVLGLAMIPAKRR